MVRCGNRILKLLIIGTLFSAPFFYGGYSFAAEEGASSAAKEIKLGEWVKKSLEAKGAGKYDEAISYADRAIQSDPNDEEAYNARGMALYRKDQKGLSKKAIENYDKAIQLKPDFFEAYGNRGNAYGALGMYDKDIEDQNMALKLSPNYVLAFNGRAWAYIQKKMYDRAIADATRAIELDNKNVDAYRQRSMAYCESGKYDLAIQDYDQAIALEPDNADFYRLRARTYLKKGDLDAVIADADRSLEKNPEEASTLFFRAEAYRGKNDFDRAIKDYTESLKLELREIYVDGAYFGRGKAYQAKGLVNEALSDFRKAAELKPDNQEYAKELKEPEANPNAKEARKDMKVGVAVFAIGRAKTPGEEALKNYLGQEQGIDYILVPFTPREFFDQLAHITKDGRKINNLIIMGHGSAESPHVALFGVKGAAGWVSEDLRAENFDVEIIKSAIQYKLELIKKAKNKLCEIKFKSSKSSKDLDREKSLEGTIQKSTKELERLKESLCDLEKIRGIMSEDACILLLNCSAAATDEGVKFVKAIGKAFLGNAGGKIIASKRDIEIQRISRDGEGALAVIGGLGKWVKAVFYHGKFVRPGDYYITAQGVDWLNRNWITLDIPAQEQEKPFYLPVTLESCCTATEQGGEVTLNALTGPYEDSGTITYFWNFSSQGTAESSYTLDTNEYPSGKVTAVSVFAKDSRAREGQDTAYVLIKKPERAIELSLSDDKPQAGSTITATARLTKGQAPKDSMWVWQSKGGLKIVARHEEEAEVKVSGKGTLTALLEYIGRFGKAQILAEKSVTIQPAGKKEIKPDDKKTPKDTSSAVVAVSKKSAEQAKGETEKPTQEGLEKDKPAGSTVSPAPKKIIRPAAVTVSETKEWGPYHLKYTISGAALVTPPEYKAPFGFDIYYYKGQLAGDTLTISGTGSCDNATGDPNYPSVLSASVSSGDKKQVLEYKTQAKEKLNKPFSLSVPVPAGASSAGFSMSVIYYSGYGPRGIEVHGSLSNEGIASGSSGKTAQPATSPKKDIVPLSVELFSSATTLLPGSIADVRATVTGGTPPYTIAWSGPHSGADTLVNFSQSEPGKYTLTANITDSASQRASKSILLTVEQLELEIRMDGASGNKVILGIPVGFSAIMKGKSDAKGALEYQWQPHPEAEFSPYQGPSPKTSVIFRRPGSTKVWVTALQSRDGALRTVAEAKQLEIDVVPPQFTLVFQPPNPLLGQEVKARIKVTPEVDSKYLDFRWLPLPASARLLAESKDAREITFTLQNELPVKVEALARTPHFGDELGGIDGTITALPYTVRVTGPRLQGPEPQVFVPGKGLTDVPRDVTVHQTVSFRAEISPTPPNQPLTYQWTASSDACNIHNPISQDPNVTCSEAGSYNLTVDVKDARGVKLGTGSGALTVVAEAATIPGGKQVKHIDGLSKEQQEKLDALYKQYDQASKAFDERMKRK